jgi:hypothetical protein
VTAPARAQPNDAFWGSSVGAPGTASTSRARRADYDRFSATAFSMRAP